jgi:hypothetical protein
MIDDWADLLFALLDAHARFLVVGAHALSVEVGLPPNRVDLLSGISGVPSFDEAWSGRVNHDVRGREVAFLGRAALIANKRATGRLKDQADLEALRELDK